MQSECMIKVIAMPKDANPDGDIFGGWIMSHMDLAGAIPARQLAKGRTVTVAIENIVFHKPVFVGDCVECYARIEKVGRTSVTVHIETYVERRSDLTREKVTEGKFVYVAIDKNRKPIEITNKLSS